MRIDEVIIDEESVISSWISDLTLTNGGSGNVTMALGNGRRYSVRGVGKQLYDAWIAAESKGKFWHQQIKNRFITVRLV